MKVYPRFSLLFLATIPFLSTGSAAAQTLNTNSTDMNQLQYSGEPGFVLESALLEPVGSASTGLEDSTVSTDGRVLVYPFTNFQVDKASILTLDAGQVDSTGVYSRITDLGDVDSTLPLAIGLPLDPAPVDSQASVVEPITSFSSASIDSIAADPVGLISPGTVDFPLRLPLASSAPKASCGLHPTGLRLNPLEGNTKVELTRPHGIAVDSTLGVIIANLGDKQEVFTIADDDTKPTVKAKFSIFMANEKTQSPRAVALGKEGMFYVPLTNSGSIRRFKPNGEIKDDIWPVATGYPVDVSIVGDTLVAADSTFQIVLGKSDGTGQTRRISSVMVQGKESKLDHPHGVKLTDNGDLWISDTFNLRMLYISAENLKKDAVSPDASAFPLMIQAGAGFIGPYGIAIDENGDLYVGIYGANEIKRLRFADDKLTEIEKITDKLGPNPRHIAVKGCDLYAVDGSSTYVVYREKRAK